MEGRVKKALMSGASWDAIAAGVIYERQTIAAIVTALHQCGFAPLEP